MLLIYNVIFAVVKYFTRARL